MDNATALKILENYGAPPTPANISKVMSMATQDSELLGRSMGLQGGGDMAGPRADLMFDKMAASTERAPMMRSRQANYGEGSEVKPDSMTNGAPQNGSNRGAVTGAQPRRGAAPNTEPPSGSLSNASTSKTPMSGDPKYTGPGDEVSAMPNGNITAQPESGLNLPNWLLAALGITAAGAVSQFKGAPANGTPQLTGPAPKPAIEGANPNQKRIGYEAKIADESAAKLPSGATEIPKKGLDKTKGMAQTPEDIARLQAEIDAENAAMEDSARKAMPQKAKPNNQNALMEAVRDFQRMFRK